MALTKADKIWLRKMHREEVAALLTDFVASQTGGYDGATEVVDEDYAEQGKAPKKRIGFAAPTPSRKAQLRKLINAKV